jgi:hypothetical protein
VVVAEMVNQDRRVTGSVGVRQKRAQFTGGIHWCITPDEAVPVAVVECTKVVVY